MLTSLGLVDCRKIFLSTRKNVSSMRISLFSIHIQHINYHVSWHAVPMHACNVMKWVTLCQQQAHELHSDECQSPTLHPRLPPHHVFRSRCLCYSTGTWSSFILSHALHNSVLVSSLEIVSRVLLTFPAPRISYLPAISEMPALKDYQYLIGTLKITGYMTPVLTGLSDMCAWM